MFRAKIDGVTILTIAIGSAIAVTQQPIRTLKPDKQTLNSEVMAKLTQLNSLIYIGTVVFFFILRKSLLIKITNSLNDFYSRTIEHYHSIKGAQDNEMAEVEHEQS